MLIRGHNAFLLSPGPRDDQPGGGAGAEDAPEQDLEQSDAPGEQEGEQDQEEAGEAEGGEAAGDDNEDGDEGGEAEGEGAEGAEGSAPAFALTDRDRRMLNGVFSQAAIDRMAGTPAGQAALTEALATQRDALLDRALDGDGDETEGERSGGGGGTFKDVDAFLAQELPDLAIADDDVAAAREALPEGVYDKTIGAYAKNQGQVRKVLSTTVKAVEGMRHTFTNVITGLQIENFLDGVNDPTYGTSADETLTPGQEAKRRQFESAFHSRMKSLGRSPTPRDVARALRAARASVDAPQAREAAVKDIHSKIEKRAKHAGAVPRNGKPGAPQPKKSVEHAARVADRFLSGDAGKGKGKK